MLIRNPRSCAEPVTKMDDVILRRYCHLHICTSRDSLTVKDLLAVPSHIPLRGTTWVIPYNVFP